MSIGVCGKRSEHGYVDGRKSLLSVVAQLRLRGGRE